MKKAALILSLIAAVPLFAEPAPIRLIDLFGNSGGSSIADVDGDGLDDLIQGTEVRFNLGGAFGPLTKMTGISTSDNIRAIGDFNDDGKLDLIVGGSNKPSPDELLLGNGHGNFRKSKTMPYDVLATIETADLDGDGHLDLLRMGDGIVHVYRGNGDGRFAYKQTISNSSIIGENWTSRIVFGDFNSDGRLDFVYPNALTPGLTYALVFATQQSDGTFAVRQRLLPAMSMNPVAADLNGDGKVDIGLVMQGAKAVYALFNDGTGRFPTYSRIAPTSNDASSNYNFAGKIMAIADLIPGGTKEITVSYQDGMLIVFSAANNQLRELYRTRDITRNTFVRAAHVRSADRLDLISEGLPIATPGIGSTALYLGLDAAPATESTAPRFGRTRAVGRVVEPGEPTAKPIVTSYDVVMSGCGIRQELGTWDVTTEGIFVDVASSRPVLAAALDNEHLFLNISLPNGETSVGTVEMKNNGFGGAMRYTPSCREWVLEGKKAH